MLEAVVDVALRAIAAGVVLGAVLALGVVLATRVLALTATTRHALWTTALVATALMPLAGVGVSAMRAQPHAETRLAMPASALENVAEAAPFPALPEPPVAHRAGSGSSAPSIGWTPKLSRDVALALVAVWLIGALIGIGGLFASVLRVRGLKKRSSPLDGTLADELPWLTEATAGREIYLRLSYETETPVAIGFGRPVILIPTELATADGLSAIEPLVLHEHAHLRRYDDWTNLVQRTIERLFWFNPLVWLIGRRIALEREIASDDAVVEKTGAPHEYATSLWRLAREMRMPEHAVVAPGALLTRKQISVRIEQLLDKNRARLHRSPAAALGAAAAGIAAVALVATSAPALEVPAPASTAVAGPSEPADAHHDAVRVIVHAAAPAAHAAHAATHPATHRSAASAAAPTTQTRVIYRIVDTPALPPFPRLPRVAETAAPSPPRSAPAKPIAPEAPIAPPAFAPSPLAHIDGRVDIPVEQIVTRSLAAAQASIAAEGLANRRARRTLGGEKPTRDLIASCVGCSLRGADLRGMDLHDLTLTGYDLHGADLSGANLAGAHLFGTSLIDANLQGADLRGAVLTGVSLSGANLDGAHLENVKLVGVSLRTAGLRGTQLRDAIATCTGCDFARMDLRGQDLHGIALSGANFTGADLRDANLSGVRFSGADLSGANLSGADLTGALFVGCDMNGANLNGAKTAGFTMRGSALER